MMILNIQGNLLNRTKALEAGRAKVDFSNVTRPYVVEDYSNGNNWYRLWSDGFIEQGGRVTPAANSTVYTVNFIKPFSAGCKTMSIQNSTYAAVGAGNNAIWPVSNTQFQYDVGFNAGYPFFWNAEGV